MAELATHTITRHGRSYSTQYIYSPNNNGDYRHPSQIIETGDLSRHTWRYYDHTTTPYLLGLLRSEYVQVGAEVWMKTWYYNANGFLTEQYGYGRSTFFTPDAVGNIASMRLGGHNDSTWYQYHYGVVSQITLPNTDVISRSIDSDGLVQSETRAGRTTDFTYDNLFRLTSTQPPGGGTPITTQYFTDRAIVTRGSSVVTTYVDGFGRPTCTVNSLNVQACTTYDADGRKASESLPAYGTPTIFTTLTYDGLGRLTRKTNPDATYVAYTYGSTSDALTVSVRDENVHVTLQALKGFGHPGDARLARVADALNNTWTYTYNALGNLTRVDAPGGLVRTWTYDGTNRLISETQPESGTVSYAYISGTALLYTKTDATGTVFTYSYDANDRVTQITADPTIGANRVTVITYEAGSDNRLTARIDDDVSTTLTTFAYDAVGRPSQRTDTVNGTPFTQTFGYNTLDRLTTLTYPSSRQVGYEYDAEGRITRVFNAATQANYASLFSYHASGAVTEYVGSNSLVHQLAFESLTHRLQSIGVVGALGLTYTYDSAGNVTQITDARGSSWTYAFGYDALDRLTSATGNGQYPSPCYAYDARGNRIHTEACQTTTYAYNGQERLTNQSGTTFTYDANGNMLTRSLPNQSYTYTAGNQLATVTLGGTTTTYQYDADGWRVRTMTGSTIVSTVRGPTGALLSDVNGSLTRDYIYAGDRLIAWAESTGAVFDLTTDAIGSVRMVTNASQAIVERHDFLPFGEEWNPPGSPQSVMKFAGKERDAETGWDYFGARYYRGNSGRLTSPDPISVNGLRLVNPQRWNRYVYAINNPLRFVDPDGMDAILVDFTDGSIGGAGHLGIIALNADGSGLYGGFGPSFPAVWRGEVVLQRFPAGLVQFGADGRPTHASYLRLQQLLAPVDGRNPAKIRFRHIRTSAAETAAAEAHIRQTAASPGSYRMFMDNSTDFAIRGLWAAGVPAPSRAEVKEYLGWEAALGPNLYFRSFLLDWAARQSEGLRQPTPRVSTTETYCLGSTCWSR